MLLGRFRINLSAYALDPRVQAYATYLGSLYNVLSSHVYK